MGLLPYNKLPVNVRRSKKELYEYIRKELDGDTEEDAPVTRTIKITVNDETDPIQGATVKIGSNVKTTGKAGGCTFTGITDGKCKVTVSHEGYTSKTEEITVSEEDTSFTISLTATE